MKPYDNFWELSEYGCLWCMDFCVSGKIYKLEFTGDDY